MAFIKRNLFYLILIVATAAVSGGVWAGFIKGKSADTTAEIEKRVQLYQSLDRLRRSDANAENVEARKKYVEDIRTQREELKKAAVANNQKDRESLLVPIPNTDEKIAAFPVDQDLYAKHSLPLLFRAAYEAEMDALFAKLHATSPPTAQEVELAKNKMIRYMEKKASAESAEGAEDASLILPPGVLPPADPDTSNASMGARQQGMPGMGMGTGMGMPMGGMPGMMPGMGMGMGMGTGMAPRTTGGTAASRTVSVDPAEAERLALNNLMILKASNPESPIYAESTSFSRHYLPTTVAAEIAEMWKANVNYWIHKHIVESINKANSMAAPQPVTIESAIVKRLIKTRVGISNSADGQASILYEGEREPANDDGTGGMGMGMGMGMGIGGMPMGGSRDSNDAGDNLTGRICNTDFDVVNFEIVVVLDAAKLPVFLECLTQGDFYTIQKVDLYGPYTNMDVLDTRTNTAQSQGDSMYYYGPNPAVKAKIKVESMLFTKWHRALMPVKMLERLPDEALNDEDNTRIEAALLGDEPEDDGGW